MTDGERILSAARTWAGTPTHHQARALGAGVDCIGLVKEVGIATGFLAPTPEQIAKYAKYARAPNPGKMGRGLREFLTESDWPVREVAPDGFICWIEWRESLPMHCGFAATFQGRRTLIHAYQDAGKVVEHGFTDLWQCRVVQWFKFPGMAV